MGSGSVAGGSLRPTGQSKCGSGKAVKYMYVVRFGTHYDVYEAVTGQVTSSRGSLLLGGRWATSSATLGGRGRRRIIAIGPRNYPKLHVV